MHWRSEHEKTVKRSNSERHTTDHTGCDRLAVSDIANEIGGDILKHCKDVIIRIEEDENGMTTTMLGELIRCGECKHYWRNHPETVAVCLSSANDDAYCSEGERRADYETD